MASELIAEAITDYFGERCSEYDADCLCCKAWYEFDRLSHADRPAPATTDTGLETVAFQHRRIDKYGVVGDWRPYKRDLFGSDRIESRELVTRSQAEELLAAKEVECAKYRDYAAEKSNQVAALQRDNAAERAENEKLEADNAELVADYDFMRKSRKKWKERAEKAEADNAAKDARIKELEEHFAEMTRSCLVERGRAETLEAKLSAAEKALETKSAANEALSKAVVESIETEKRLREALEPFSKFAGAVFERNFNNADVIFEISASDGGVLELKGKDFFEARAVLGGKPS